MSTGHMPNPPDQPTTMANMSNSASQTATPEAVEAPEQAPALSLNEDMARIITEQADVIVQRYLYHAQMMYGVGGIGADPVNAHNTTRSVASSIRSNDPTILRHALINLGDPQLAQVNDHTVPFNFNAQVAGLLEGIIVDTLNKAYLGDAQRQQQSRMMLEQIFIDANEVADRQPKAMLAFNAPGPDPNARR